MLAKENIEVFVEGSFLKLVSRLEKQGVVFREGNWIDEGEYCELLESITEFLYKAQERG